MGFRTGAIRRSYRPRPRAEVRQGPARGSSGRGVSSASYCERVQSVVSIF